MNWLAPVTGWTIDAVAALLTRHGYSHPAVSYVGSGHWSDCFAFSGNNQDLVIRLGTHLEDFLSLIHI